jgi:hypothetical protein
MTPLDDLIRTARIDATHYADCEQLIKPIDSAAAELAGLRENAYASARLRVELNEYKDCRVSLLGTVDQLRAALDEFGNHKPTCCTNFGGNDKPCDCGYLEFIITARVRNLR